MKRSIRQFLLFSILPCIFISTLITILGNYIINHDSIRLQRIHAATQGSLSSKLNQLGFYFIKHDIVIVLIVFVILALTISYFIRRAMAPIKRVTQEVAQYDRHNPKPIGNYPVPIEIKPLVDELNSVISRLQQSLDRERRFASDAAHELKTPLAGIKTQLQVAMSAPDDSTRKETLSKLLTGVNRTSHIIEQLLTLSRLNPGKDDNHQNKRLFKLSSAATDVIADLAPKALEKNIDVELIAPNYIQPIYANPVAINILIRNLVDNAIRYIQEYGSIKVSLIDSENNVILRVSDNGPGIPEELQTRVMERFFRILGNKSPGSGLGMAIVQQIAQMHNATVELSSTNIDKTGLQVDILFPKGKP